jgi:hypothetical protein
LHETLKEQPKKTDDVKSKPLGEGSSGSTGNAGPSAAA